MWSQFNYLYYGRTYSQKLGATYLGRWNNFMYVVHISSTHIFLAMLQSVCNNVKIETRVLEALPHRYRLVVWKFLKLWPADLSLCDGKSNICISKLWWIILLNNMREYVPVWEHWFLIIYFRTVCSSIIQLLFFIAHLWLTR